MNERNIDFEKCSSKNGVHDWQIDNLACVNGSYFPSSAICTKCRKHFELSAIMQLKAFNHMSGFQRKFSVASIVISLVALTFSILFAYLPYRYNLQKDEIRKNCWKIAPSTIESNTEKNYQACLRDHGIE